MSTALDNSMIIPDAMFTEESSCDSARLIADFTEIRRFYDIYRNGAAFPIPQEHDPDSNFIPANLMYRMSASLINKQARFLFASPPDIVIEPNDSISKPTGNDGEAISRLESLVRNILYENQFEEALVKAAKDCFIGKRVAGVVNFHEEHGVTLTFLPATQFIFETDLHSNVITKFVFFKVFYEESEKRIFRKKYMLEKDGVYIEEAIHDGNGQFLHDKLAKMKSELTSIPVAIFVNDGLTGDTNGESEIGLLEHTEGWYSKMSNADIDSGRQNMNPIRYTVNMNPVTVKGLRIRPGENWNVAEDQDQDRGHADIGVLETSMNYSVPLKTTLDRMKTMAHELVDVPNITLESMAGVITSGKSLKALYWSLIVRCKEKMKVWGPQLRHLIKTIIDGSYLYPNCIKRYSTKPLVAVGYEVSIIQNHPLFEDDIEEKAIDLQEVEARTMSRKEYMKKWRELTDKQVEEELNQIGWERQILEDYAFQERNTG
jgi:hypothetical protein